MTSLIVAAPAVAKVRALPSTSAGAGAELTALCSRHAMLLQAVNRGDDGEEEDGPAWQAHATSAAAIDATAPQTIAGMLAKARAAKAEARLPNGDENPDACKAEAWAWALVNDLLHLAGNAV